MKIFTITQKNQKEFAQVTDHLKKVGHSILDISKQQAVPKKETAFVEKNIKDVDIVIVDITQANFRTGYIISKALSEKKVVIALTEVANKDEEAYIAHSQSKNLIVEKFTKDNIIEVTDKALEEAKKRLDTKFILIISPEIDRYLDWASHTKRMHKAQLVRNAVEAQIKKDRDYKKYSDGK